MAYSVRVTVTVHVNVCNYPHSCTSNVFENLCLIPFLILVLFSLAQPTLVLVVNAMNEMVFKHGIIKVHLQRQIKPTVELHYRH